jgi:hypothetical protein
MMPVAPSFIDLHKHGQGPRNYQFQSRDGVTTSLELEGGTADVANWYAIRDGKALINYGVSIGHIPVRTVVMAHLPPDLPNTSFERGSGSGPPRGHPGRTR